MCISIKLTLKEPSDSGKTRPWDTTAHLRYIPATINKTEQILAMIIIPAAANRLNNWFNSISVFLWEEWSFVYTNFGMLSLRFRWRKTDPCPDLLLWLNFPNNLFIRNFKLVKNVSLEISFIDIHIRQYEYGSTIMCANQKNYRGRAIFKALLFVIRVCIFFLRITYRWTQSKNRIGRLKAKW